MSGFREIFFYFKGFSETDINHSDEKCAHVQLNFFLLVKNYFSKFPKFFTTKCLEYQKVFL